MAFKPPETQSKKEIDFTPQPTIGLRADRLDDRETSVVSLLKGAADVSQADRSMYNTFDVNEFMRVGNLLAAENLLGRKVTDQEMSARQVTTGRRMPTDLEKIQLEARREIMKEAIKKELLRQKKLHTQFEELKKKLEKKRVNEAYGKFDQMPPPPGGSFAPKSGVIPRIPQVFFNLFGNMYDEDKDLDKADDDELESIADTVHATTSLMQAALSQMLPEDEHEHEFFDDESIAPTVVAERARIGPPLQENREDTPEAPESRIPSAYDHPWTNKPERRTIKINQARAEMLLEYSSGPGGLPGIGMALHGYKSMNKDALMAAVDEAQEIMDRKAAETRGKRMAKEDAKAKKVEEVQEGTGLSLFNGQKRVSHPENYKRFGPRFLIDKSKLKNGTFSLLTPGGQKPTLIRNAQLSAALKEVVTSFLDGEPQDTSQLDEKELQWWQWMWKNAKLGKQPVKLPILAAPVHHGKKPAMDRIKVLMGEVVSGNNNPQVLEELTKIIDKINQSGWLKDAELVKLRQFISGQES